MANNINSTISGTAAVPLISFNTIIDEDIACIKYSILEIGKNPSFNFEKLKSKKYTEMVADIYHRKYRNPLYYITSKNANKDLIDRVYNELITINESDVLKHAVATDMCGLVEDFKKSSEIIPTILYYTEPQSKLIKSIKSIANIDTISIQDAKRDPNRWSQFYFKYIDEIEPFKNLGNRTFYFSTIGVNLNEDNSDIIMNKDDILFLIKKRNKITLFDIYRTDIIGSYKNDK